MPIMTGYYEFADVVLVPFPFTDQSATKKRPAAVISSDAYLQERPDLIIMAITSQVKPDTDRRRGDGQGLARSGTAQAFCH
jgi:mRNA-degrading endonuclease toxin of MazEF toxin-antitoxin module